MFSMPDECDVMSAVVMGTPVASPCRTWDDSTYEYRAYTCGSQVPPAALVEEMNFNDCAQPCRDLFSNVSKTSCSLTSLLPASMSQAIGPTVDGMLRASELNYDTAYLEVSIDVDAENGMTAAQFVEIWNGLSEANLLFAASVGEGGGTWGAGDGFAETPYWFGCDGAAEAFVDQSISVTFNQAVTVADFSVAGDEDVEIASWDGEGAAYTIVMVTAESSTGLVVPGVAVLYADACSLAFPSVCTDPLAEWDIG